MQNKFVRISLQVVAVLFIVFGLLGLFLPFLQGILFLLMGITLFSLASPAFKAWLDRRLERFPKVKARFNRMHERMTKWFN